MTPDERSLLSTFLQDLARSRGEAKDPEADRMINDALAASPDAAYLLVQHAILSDQALHAAQAQIADLQAQLASARPPAPAPGFLPRPGPWSQPAPGPGYYGPGPFSGGGGLGSFLRNAGTTAAGVAGGELLFEGLSGLFGHHAGFGYGGGYEGAPIENITNNYYDDSGDTGGGFDDGGTSSV